MNLFKKDRKTLLYGGLIITFIILYVATAFVSWYHAITFFNIANAVWLSVILSFVAEIGQASVLFAILLTKNKYKFLPWAIMIILTSLQVIGNVVSSYKYIIVSNSLDFEYFQKSILFWVQTANPEMFKVIIAWISGGILPLIALSMTALVAENMQHFSEENNENKDQIMPEETFNEDLSHIKEQEPISKQPIVETQKVEEPEKNNYEMNAIIDDGGIGGEEAKKEAKQLEEELNSMLDIQEKMKEEPKKITEEVEKEIIKKRGRPKVQNKETSEIKKEGEPLQAEEIEVPIKTKRFVDPLKIKNKKVKPIKKLEEIIKPSKGEEVIKLLESIEKNKEKELANKPEDKQSDNSLVPPELLTPYIETDGVSVIDAKAISKEKQKKTKHGVDKFGIPVQKGEKLNFDRI